MKCPNCNKEMQKSETFEQRNYYIGDGDYLDAYMKVFHYKCAACCIKVSKDENRKEMKWSLPENLKPTQKQIDYAKSIASRLNKDIGTLVTKKDYSKFISENVDEYKRKKKRDYDVDLYNLSLELEEWGVIDPGMFC